MATVNQRYVKDASGQWWFHFTAGRRTRVDEWKCPHCKKAFPAYRPGHRRARAVYCSRACSAAHHRKPKRPYICRWCEQQFQPTGGGQRFCSHSCAKRWNDARRPPIASATPDVLANAANKHFQQDETGQWWYRAGKKKVRSRAHIERCSRCQQLYLRSIYHKTTYCSRRCGVLAGVAEGRKKRSGARSAHWKGGRNRNRQGYVAIYAPYHPSIKVGHRKYVLEHRLVMEQTLGRFLEAHEFVHHKNGIKSDNRPENLELWSHGHPPGQRDGEHQHCPTCSCFVKGT